MITGLKYLVTTDNWFYAPDGKLYNGVWGTVTTLDAETTLGTETNHRSTNWYIKVGSEDNHVIVAGCQVNYAVRCEEMPVTNDVEEFRADIIPQSFKRPTGIYIAI